MKTIEFHKAFMIVLIILGVCHILAGLACLIQGIREAITVSEMTDKKWQGRDDYSNYSQSNSMLKSAIMPFIAGAGCIFLALKNWYWMLFINIGLAVIEMFLYFFSFLTILHIDSDYKVQFETAKEKRCDSCTNPNDDIYAVACTLAGIVFFNKVVLVFGLIVAFATPTCMSWIWKLYRPGGLVEQSRTGTFTL